MRLRRVVTFALVGFAVLAIAFGMYLSHLYRQLDASFGRQEQFIPTRIYSDVIRIFPGQSISRVEGRLKSLGYTWNLGGPGAVVPAAPSPKPEDGGESGEVPWLNPESAPPVAGEVQDLTFRLHPVDYPAYLLPDGHPTQTAGGEEVTLQFETRPKAEARLKTLFLAGKPLPDIYLEPELVATLTRGSDSHEVRELVKFEDIPAQVWKAIIAIEDQHFEEHKGFDPRGLARAIWVNLRTRSFAQGGSTLTQQLVKNLTARRGKDVFRKINELFLALMLEARFSKQQILERYLNEVYLGQIGNLEVHGVAEGARYFFAKRLDELNLGECALIAALIRGPAYYSPYRYRERAMERQKLVLRKMVETGQIAEGEAKEAMETPIRFAPPQLTSNKAPYFVDFAKAELIRQLGDRFTEQEIPRAGFRVYTTLDMALNAAAQQAVGNGISELEKKLGLKPGERLEGVLAAVEQSTGQIRALIGGRSYAQSTFNRILNMKRQVGSTFKPVVYLSAFRKGEDPLGIPYGPGHPAEDAPWKLVYDHGKQEWSPKNYEKEFRGWTSYRQALAHSVNTIAAKVGFEVGIPNIIQTARDLGVESDLPAVPSLALGVAELSPIELLKVYGTIANHGLQEEFTVIRSIHQNDGAFFARFVSRASQVVEPGPADLLTDMMQNVFTEGTAAVARKLGFDRPAAGKTGTTSDHRDSWFAGFTPEITAVVWVGADQQTAGKSHVVLTGASSALPIWVNFMKAALDGKPADPFPSSPELTTVTIDQKSGKQALIDCPATQTITEKFIKGHTPRNVACDALWPETVSESKGP